jgi:hypothetical protein
MLEIERELLALKDRALAATQNRDGAFYEDYLDDDAIAVTPHGVFGKRAIIQQMSASDSSFKSTAIEDTRAIVLTPESGIVTYKATFGARSVLVTTVYVKKPGGWKGVFYQQTPVP